MILFRSSATPQDGKISFIDENLAKKILRVCKGSPLALKVVGKLLCGEPTTVWQSKVTEWDQGKSIFISGLRSSLDALDEEVENGLSAITYLHQLSDRNLVSLVITRKIVIDGGYYNDHFVMQYDLLIDMIIHRSMSEPI
ncbi:hypothetical protein QYF36_010166 [Acer negundo]|nr:hypothetical protein QYF36_010166 [Acer negundo]